MSYLSKLHREKDEMRLVGFARVFSRLCARNAFMKWRMRGSGGALARGIGSDEVERVG